MKRKILICLLVLGLGVGTATAQFGSGIVYDPTNYHNALLRYYQLQQQLVQLQKSYTKITTQLNLALQMAAFVQNMPARYRALFSQWRNVTSLQHFREYRVSWINGINSGLLPNHQHRLPARPQPHCLQYDPYELSGMDACRTRARAVPVRVRRTRRRRKHECDGHHRFDPRQRPEHPDPDRKPRTGFVLGRLRSQQRSLRPEQDQCGGSLDSPHGPGLEQTPRVASGTANHPREATARRHNKRHQHRHRSPSEHLPATWLR